MSQNRIRLLIIDDEPQIRRFLTIALKHEGYGVESAEDGESGLRLVRALKPDIILLDLGLPGIDGQDVLKHLRDEGVLIPIIVLSARNEPNDIIQALDRGADDYLTKPFGMNELFARLRSLKRRAMQTQTSGNEILKVRDLQIDLTRHEVKLGDRQVDLSPKEFKLLYELACHANKVLTHRHLLMKVWGPAQADEHQYLRVYMGQLRKKLSINGIEPTYIRTLQGIGYIFDLEDK